MGINRVGKNSKKTDFNLVHHYMKVRHHVTMRAMHQLTQKLKKIEAAKSTPQNLVVPKYERQKI